MTKNRFEVSEIAEKLGYDVRTVYRHIREGKLPAAKPGRAFLVTRSDLAVYLGSEERVNELFGRENGADK